MAWMIDGNKLKEKAVSLLFPTKMESCGHLPNPVQAVTVSEIEGMLYREGVEVVRCKDCKFYLNDTPYCQEHKKGYCEIDDTIKDKMHFCSYGERREAE